MKNTIIVKDVLGLGNLLFMTIIGYFELNDLGEIVKIVKRKIQRTINTYPRIISLGMILIFLLLHFFAFSLSGSINSSTSLGVNSNSTNECLTVNNDFSNRNNVFSENWNLSDTIDLAISSMQTGCREFQFNVSSGIFETYFWTSPFVDTSTLSNPIFTYPFNEQFEVCVTVFDTQGCSFSECIFLTVDDDCDNCDISFTFTQDCYDLSFLPNADGYEGNPSYEWLMNDVFQSEAPFFSISEGPGTYNVCLTASDLICSNTYCETIVVDPILTTITNCPLGPISLNAESNCEVENYTPPLGFVNDCLINPIGSYSIEYVRGDGLDIEDAFRVGFTSIQAIFEGDFGEITTCNFSVQVIDNIPPECNVQDIIISTEGETGTVVNFPFEAVDNCGEANISYSSPTGMFYECGEYLVTAEVQDQFENSVECDFLLSVVDCDGCCVSETQFNEITAQGFTAETINQGGINCAVQLFPVALTECHRVIQLRWDDGTITNGNFPHDLDFIHEYTAAGLFEICITVQETEVDGCFEKQICQTYTVTPNCTITNTNEIINSTQVTIFPNPTSKIVQIKSDFKFKEYTIYDLFGNKLTDRRLENNSLSLSYLTPGTYFLKLQKGENYIIKKIIKID